MADLVKSISEIFSNRSFTIPDYQRGFSWGQKEINDLWEDLELLPINRDHFTGTLVLKPKPSPDNEWIDRRGEDHHVFDINDGQQRITSTIILLKAIHSVMKLIEEDTDLIKGIQENYLFCEDSNHRIVTLLIPNRDSRDYFRSQILMDQYDPKGEVNRSVKNMEEAKNLFLGKIKIRQEELGDDFPIWLGKLRSKVTRQLKFIVYEVANELDAGTIFETMNDRGKPISEMDKIKNYFLYICSKIDVPDVIRFELSEKINLTWTRIFEELLAAKLGDEKNENQLLRFHWLMAYDYNSNNWDNSRSIKAKFNLKNYVGKHDDLYQAISQYLVLLQKTVTAYCDINNPENPNAFNEIKNNNVKQEIQALSIKLRRMGSKASFQPLLIAVRLCGGSDGEVYKQVVELCEKFDFRVYGLTRHRSGTGQSTLFRIGNEYYNYKNLQAILNKIKETIWYYCSDSRFLQRFELENENWYSWSGIKYFLYEYEQHLAELKGVPVRMPWEFLHESRKEDTIEHILPQTPLDEYWTIRFPNKEDRLRWINDIGNLTLTYNNSSMSNKPSRKGITNHDDKVSYYQDSIVIIEQILKDEKEWNHDAIMNRREQIKKWAITRWKVEPPTGGWEKDISIKKNVSQLPRDQKREIYFQKYVDDADRLGNGEQFRSIIEIAKKFPLYLYLNPNYDAPSFNLRTHRTTWMLWLGPDLYVCVNCAEFDHHFSLDTGSSASIIGQERRKLTHEEVPEFIDRLSKLLDLIQS